MRKKSNRISEKNILQITLVQMAWVIMFSVGCNNFPKNSATTDLTQPLVKTTPNIASSDPSERELCIETARTVAEKGHAREAILLYERAEQLAPSAPTLDLELAPLYAEIGDTESATRRYRHAIANGQAAATVFNNLAWTLMESQQFQDAESVIRDGLLKEPSNKRLRTTGAVLAYKSGNHEEAKARFSELYGPAETLHNLAVLDLDHGKVQTAIARLDSATQLENCPLETIEFRDSLLPYR